MSYGTEDETPPFVAGKACDACTVVLQGRLHVVCGSEGFESDRGPWTVLGAPSLRQQNYVADFTARVMEPSRLLQIHRDDYEAALKRESQALAAAVRAEAAYHARAREQTARAETAGARGHYSSSIEMKTNALSVWRLADLLGP